MRVRRRGLSTRFADLKVQVLFQADRPAVAAAYNMPTELSNQLTEVEWYREPYTQGTLTMAGNIPGTATLEVAV